MELLQFFNNDLTQTNNSLETFDNRFISDLGKFKIFLIKNTMPAEIAEKRISFNHSAGKAFLLSANCIHTTNKTWYLMTTDAKDDTYCIFASNQIRLGVTSEAGKKSFSGQEVRMLVGIFE